MIFLDKNSTLIFLHGFLGNHHDFDNVIKELPSSYKNNCLSIDLPGHNNNEPASYEESIDYIDNVISSKGIDGDFILYGYALGGRLAINYAFKRKNPKLKGLIIESASFGLTENERKLRTGKDIIWASQFALKKPREILTNWYNQPRFKSLSDKEKKMLIERRMNQDFHKIAIQFDITSVARLDNFREKINELPFNVIYLYGEQDDTFCEIAKRESKFLNFVPIKINDASHNIHTFFPSKVASILKDFMEN